MNITIQIGSVSVTVTIDEQAISKLLENLLKPQAEKK